MKRKLTCTNYFIILEKNDIKESTPKIQMLTFRLGPDVTFLAVGYLPLLEFRLAFHIYYVKY